MCGRWGESIEDERGITRRPTRQLRRRALLRRREPWSYIAIDPGRQRIHVLSEENNVTTSKWSFRQRGSKGSAQRELEYLNIYRSRI